MLAGASSSGCPGSRAGRHHITEKEFLRSWPSTSHLTEHAQERTDARHAINASSMSKIYGIDKRVRALFNHVLQLEAEGTFLSGIPGNHAVSTA